MYDIHELKAHFQMCSLIKWKIKSLLCWAANKCIHMEKPCVCVAVSKLCRGWEEILSKTLAFHYR